MTGHDLAVEEAVLLRRDRELLRALGVLVHVGAAHLVALGDVDRGQAHVDVGVRLAVLADQVRVLVVDAGGLGALVEAADELDPGGDVGVALARLDRVRRMRGSRRGTRRSSGRWSSPVTVSGAARRAATTIRAMLNACRPCGMPQPQIDLLDRLRDDVGVSLQQPVDDVRRGLLGAKLGQRSLERAPDRACGRRRRSRLRAWGRSPLVGLGPRMEPWAHGASTSPGRGVQTDRLSS